ncbi:MAG TPA: radical SAM protein [Firmicutes bacterium]|nr:radical SAM protein [Bacillota bacterium]
MNNLTLIIPPSPIRDFPDRAGLPLGSVMLASMVREFADVTIIDSYSKAFTPDKTVELAISANPDLVGISVPFSFSLEPAVEIAQKIRRENENVPIVMGGLEASLSCDELLKSGVADFVSKGESEFSFSELAKKILESGIDEAKNSPLDGIAFIDSGSVWHIANRDLIPDLDILPFPAYDFLPGFPDEYDARMECSRGCGFRCPFCASCGYWGNVFRGKSIGRIVDEISLLVNGWGIRQISFADDTFNRDKNRAREIASAIEKSKLRINFGASCNPSILDKADLEIFAQSGMNSMFLGLESGSKRVLKSINKSHKPDRIIPLVETAESLGIKVHASFMIGLPDETAEDIEKTLNFAEKLPASSLGFHIFHPLRGSEYGENPSKYGIEFVETIEKVGAIDTVAPIRTKHLSPMEILDYYYRARGIADKRLSGQR